MNKYIEMLLCVLIVFGIASIVPCLLFGLFAIFYIAIGSFPVWIWFIPSVLSVMWYSYYFSGID